jgi:hypothetical protein
MVRPWREARPPIQTICSRLKGRGRLERHSFFSGCLTVYATALCLAMNSANDASVIYLPRTKAAPLALFGLADDLGAVPSGGGRPPSLLLKPLWRITKSGWNFVP